jgi:phosphoribosylanthranilate isomerase
MTTIKASTITNLSDARYFAAQYSVEWLGFCLDEGHEAYLSPYQLHAMKEWIEGPKIVGEFGLQDETLILNQIKSIGLDAVQLPMFSTIATDVIREQATLLREIVIEQDLSLTELTERINELSETTDLFVLDFEKTGWQFSDLLHHETIGIGNLRQICQKYPILLSINANAMQWRKIVDEIQPQGIVLKGGEEERVGYKSFDDLNTIFELLD